MPAPGSRPGPPPALVVALAAVVGGWLSVHAWPPWPAGPAARAVAALTAPGARARVVRTVDGDTAVVRFRDARGSGTATVRYLGVDAPESVDPVRRVGCLGPEASRRNRAWATGRRVRVRFDAERTDPYGRLLATLTPDGWRRSLSERLVAEGLARVLTIPPNGALAPRLGRVQEEARRGRRGLWGRCGNPLPSGT